ncbi:PKD domain-containing protein [Cohnella lupini]|nr:PKD domain-containing protein [Cohnella lupini]
MIKIPGVTLTANIGLNGEPRHLDGTYAPGVVGYRYYVPVLYTIIVEPIAVTGTAHISHFATDGTSLNNVFPNRTEVMTSGQSYTYSYPSSAGYTYKGWKKSTVSPPSGGTAILTPADPPPIIYDGSYGDYYVNYYYDKPEEEGTINVRHMVRTSTTGAYSQSAVSSDTIAVPGSRTYSANSVYGSINGYSLSYSAYSNSPQLGGNATANLTTSQKTAYITFFYQSNSAFTGDFDIIPSSIAWRDSFALKPINFILKGCTYMSHQFKIEKDGSTWTSAAISGKTSTTSFTGSSYPYVIGVGTHNVYLKIKTSNCGESAWIGPKTLNVSGPTSNSPPTFEAGWTLPNQPNRAGVKTSVVVGTRLDIVMLSDPAPSDPDGDWVEFLGFDFSAYNEWSQDVPNKGVGYMDGVHDVLMDTVGTFCGKGTLRDQWGLTVTRVACVTVVPPNPIPVIAGSTSVIEGRPLAIPLNANNSYSPIGRTIDHARDEWANRQSSYSVVGTEQVKLDVYDSAGLRSLSPAVHNIEVKPDLPPVAQLSYTAKTVRGVPVTFRNTSYSPDGDMIVTNIVQMRYDANNDGLYLEPPTTMTMDGSKQFVVNPTKVGKYQFNVRVVEDWGKQDSKNFMMEVINDSPTVAFYAQGEVGSPPEPGVTYSVWPNDLMSSAWSTTIGGKPWSIDTAENSISTVNLFNLFSDTPGGITPVNSWKGVSFDQVTVGPVFASDVSNPIFKYMDYEIRVIATNSLDSIAVYRNGVEVRRLSTIQYQGADEELQYIFVTDQGYNDRVYTFKGIAEGAAPIASVYNGEHYNASVGDSYFIAGSHKLQDISVIRFNHNAKLIEARDRDYGYPNSPPDPSLVYYGTVTTHPFTNIYGNPIGSIYKGDVPAGNIGGDFTGTGIMNPIGYDSKGNMYYETWRSFNSSAGTYGVMLAKMDGNTGDHLISYDDGISSGSAYSNNRGKYGFGTRIVGNEDGTKIVYSTYESGGYYGQSRLIVRNEATGVLLQTTTLTTNPEQILTRYKNVFYTLMFKGYNSSYDQTIYARSFDNPNVVLWSKDIGQADIKPTINGFLYYLNSRAPTKIFQLDLETGLEKSIDLSSSLGNSYYRFGKVGEGYLEICGSNDTCVNVSDDAPQRGYNYDTFGMFYSNTIPDLANFNVSYQMKINSGAGTDPTSGVSFRNKRGDNQNMYRVESSMSKTKLLKVVNGQRTVLAEYNYSLALDTYYTVKVDVLFDRIKVYMNGVPVINVTDKTFASAGTIGIFANASLVEFKKMIITETKADVLLLDNIAIVGEPISFMSSYFDTENDPIANLLKSWKIQHVNPSKFLDSGDGKSGLSSYHGTNATGVPPSLDKVGLYNITYKVPDDPNPDYLYPSMAFADYRELSNEYGQDIIVHRKPLSIYALSIDAATKKVKWADTSYDPDRYLSSTHYSSADPATGINYLSTRGIIERKYYFVSPSGVTKSEKLITPTEMGLYTTAMAVKDEYGAWSDWNEQQINITTIVTPNSPPVPGFTTSYMNTYRDVDITIDSTAYDAEDGDRTKLKHEYYIRNLTTNGVEGLYSTSRTSWIKSFNTMGTFNIRQVVEDLDGATAQFERQITIHNRIPMANVTVPSSTDPNNPTELTELRPTFSWTYNDQDGDPEAQYQVQIYRLNGTLLLDSGIKNGSAISWNASADLPEHVTLYIQVRSFDDYDWGNWSSRKYFVIETNKPPIADFDWTPKPAWEGDVITFLNRSSDPDNDLLSYSWSIGGPGGFTRSSVSAEPVLTMQDSVNRPGIYTVALTVRDPDGASDTVTKQLTVGALAITGKVNHTPEWEEHRLNWNVKYPDKHREANVFWAGEAFALEATVTDTGSSDTKPIAVVAAANAGLSKDLTIFSLGFAVWKGLLRQEDTELILSDLPHGPYSFIFTVTYSNGVTKASIVPILIKGTVDEYVQVHRVQ